MGNDWFHEYFIDELKAIGRKPTSNMQHEVVDSLPSSGNEQTIYFVKNDSSSSNNHYDEYVWISSSSTFEKIGSTQIDDSTTQPDWNQNDDTQPDYVKNRPFYTGDPVETVLIKETTAPFADSGYGYYMAEVASTFAATDGETYKVSWDGAVYECTCMLYFNMFLIGNQSIMGLDYDTGEPFIIGIINGQNTKISTLDTSAFHTFSIISSETAVPVIKIDEKYLPDTLRSFKPAGKSYLTFSSLSSFSLAVRDATKHWNGTLEYFTSDRAWTTWDGTNILSAVADDGEYVLYLRGTGNTIITGNGNMDAGWYLNGTDIKCIGNIENLLDYAIVESGLHPTLANYCYQYMFYGCTSLAQAPTLPATTLAAYCYLGMFQDCTSLTQAPTLPATTLEEYCYQYMFYGCTSLAQAPTLPATTLAAYCYLGMFQDCTSLTQAPALPAATLAHDCYQYMFRGCTNLTKIPALPATALAAYCYQYMFYGCTSLKLSSTQTDEYTQEYRIPSSGNGTTATGALTNMLFSTGGTFTGTPEINTTYYLSSDNMIVRETEIATLNGYVSSMIDAALSKINVAEEGAY